MRDHLILVSASLLAGSLTFGSALAEPRPGWVDPPSKPAAQATPSAEPDKPAAPALNESPRASARRTAQDTVAGSSRPTEAKISRRRAAYAGETRRSIRKTPSRLVFNPSPPSGPAPAVNDPRFPEWASQAQRLTLDYLDNVSAPNAESLARAQNFYASHVRRFGRTETLASLLADKRRFAQRWPERRYAAQPGAIQTSCNAAMRTCIVRATFDYRAQNPARGTRSQGIGELVLEISFSEGRPVIVAESGRVLRRAASATLVDARAKPGA
ncbi:hypothetical protein [uncultured Methylobacterium sp.]|uniref:hypothetical protein n=1 Tax=uncultured Methylobacterium sp. TaxID=157278 RepID=UPI0035CB55E6